MTAALIAILAVVSFAAAVFPVSASANNQSNVKLDAVAAHVARHPVSVWCETSWTDWLSMVAAENLNCSTSPRPGTARNRPAYQG
ncbi:MAG: hypothetical protein ABI948_12120, partial [Thermoleophilia bacterium]